MSNFKNIHAPKTTKTFDRTVIEKPTGNIYEAIVIMGKRAEQINLKLRSEMTQKLEEFATHNDNLDELFENREQIEVSRYYEKLSKPSSIAIQEWLDGEIYFRNPQKTAED